MNAFLPSRFSQKIFAVFFVLFTGFISPLFSQVDFEFWFAAPYGNQNHAPQWPTNYQYKIGGRPIFLHLATQDADATVVVSIPANPLFVPITVHIPANSTMPIELTSWINDIQSSKTDGTVENKAIYIRSSALITAYYEIASVLNTDIFSLKGQNALGTEFYAPIQNLWSNDPIHNGTSVSPIPDPAYSYIIIAATENNTEVNVTPSAATPTTAAGITRTILLNRGETYVIRASSQSADAGKLGGTYITSNKKIAVTVADDSVYPQDYVNSGDCEDYAGDQIVPTDIIGKEYIVVKGQGYKGASEGDRGVDFQERVFITATVDNTEVFVNGSYYTTLDAGKQTSYQLGGGTTANYTFITTSEPAYAYHHSGYRCEMASAMLPSVDGCTGSYKMGFVRTYGNHANEEFYMNLMVKGGGEGDFLLNGAPNETINNATFQTIIGTDWRVARIYFSPSDLPVGAYYLQNTTSLFHMAMMNSTAHDWGDGAGYRLMGAMYGYFSKFSDNEPTAIIVNNNDTSIVVSQGTPVSLLAGGGYEFSWTGYVWNGLDWELLPEPYYMNVTDVENPYVIINTLGVYKYTASITTECYGVQNKSVLIRVVEPVDLNNVFDTVCATYPYVDISEFYNLYNLNDTIVGKQGLLTGYYVDSWYKEVAGGTEIWDDFEANRVFVGQPKNGTITTVANPTPSTANPSPYVGHLRKTSMDRDNPAGLEPGYNDWNLYNQSVWYDIDLTTFINLSQGTQFSFDIMYDGTTMQSWEYGNHMVYLELFDNSGGYARLPGGTLGSAHLQNPEWITMNFDFTGYDLVQINKVRIRIHVDNYWSIQNRMPWGYYIDNIQREIVPHQKQVEDASNYRVTNGDVLIAKVLNHFDLGRVDYADATIGVLPIGVDGKDITITDICATSGNQLAGFDLTEYNYDVGGALVADKYWYLDPMMSIPIDNPTNVTVTGTQTFWAFIDDECGNIGSLTIEVSPIPQVQDATIDVCEVVPLGGNRGIVNLLQERSRITSDAGATVIWYSDPDFSIPVADESQVFVTDGEVFYAEVFYNAACISTATLTVTVIPLPDITFDDFALCEDAGVVTLQATPPGGVYSGPGVVGNEFDPQLAGAVAGGHELTYTITNQGCSHLEHATATVHPEVTASIIQVPARKLQVGESTNLQATIEPAPASQYSYSWSPAGSLVSTNTLNPTTTALTVPTTYTLTVTNPTTGCDATASILVDVYVPVNIDLKFSLDEVCAGTPVTVSPNRTGGFGPYVYNWTIPAGVDYTMVNDSLVRLNNPQPSSVQISVSVTDLGITPNDVVSDTKTLIVHANPNITMPVPSPVCENSHLQINPTVSGGTPAYTHEWSQDVAILSSNVNDNFASINTDDYTGTFYLRYTVTDQNNCVARKDVTVLVNPRPVVTASTVDKTCVGEPVLLHGTVVQGNTAGGTHAWITPQALWLDDLSSTTIPNPIFSSNTYGFARFQYVFVDANGCTDTSHVVTIQVQPKPVVTINPVAPQCVSSQGVYLTANATVPTVPSATFTYNWTGDVVSDLASPLLPRDNPGEKNVSLVVTADNGCVSDPATLKVIVNPNPIAEIVNPTPMSVCELSDLEIRANTAQPNVVFDWEGTAQTYLTPKTGSTVVFNAPAVTPQTVYNVVLNAENTLTGCKGQTNKDITVYLSPKVELGQDIELCIGWDTILHPSIDFAIEPYQIRWMLDTTELSNTSTLNPRFTLRDNNTYKVGLRITDTYGCSGYDEISILPLANPIANAGIDRIEDWNEPFNLNGSATGGTPSYTYNWQPADSLLTSNTVPNPSSVLQESTRFILRVEDARGCFDYDTVEVTVIGQPITVRIEQMPDPLCYGSTVTLTAYPGGGTGIYAYQWYKISEPHVVIGTQNNIVVDPLLNTEYGVRVSSGSFDPAQATHLVVVNPLPTISIQGGNMPELCLGATYQLTPNVVGTAPYSYEWSDGGPLTITSETYLFNQSQTSGPKTVNVKVTDALGCEADIDVIVTVHPLPIVDIIPNNPYICIDVEQPLEAVVSGNGTAPYIYTWSALQGNITSVDKNAHFSAQKAGNYVVSVVVRDAHNCSANATELITVNPYATLALPERKTVCAGEDLTLSINSGGIPGNYTMHWVGGDRNRIVDSTNILNTVFRSANEGEYVLYYTIEDEYGCPRLDTIQIGVYPTVTLAAMPDVHACEGVSLEFEATIIQGNPSLVTYAWLGNVSPTAGKVTNFSSSVAGTYPIRVLAGDANCSDEVSFNVTVHQNPRVQIVNAPIRQVDYNASVMLQGNVVNYTTSPYVYSWFNPALISSGAATQTPVTTPIITTQSYMFTMTDAYGCKDSASITLQTELIIIEIKVPNDPTDDPKIPKDKIVDPTIINLTSVPREVCLGESVVLVPQIVSGNSASFTYSWKDDEGNFISSDINPKVTPTKMYTTYTLTITNAAGFSTSASFRVIAHMSPSASIHVFPDYNGTYYIDDQFTINGNPTGGSGTYVSHAWTVSNATIASPDQQISAMTVANASNVSMTYFVTDSKGCSTTTTRTISVVEQIIPHITPNDACQWDTVTYKLSHSYPAGTFIQWSVNGGQIVGASNNTTVDVYWPDVSSNATVSVIIVPPGDKIIQIEEKIAVGAMPQVEIAGPAHVCVDETAKYNAVNIGGSQSIVYGWQIATDISNPLNPYYAEFWDGQDDELLQNVSLNTEQATVHWKFEGVDKVVLTARDGGCVTTVDMDVTIHPLPKPDFMYQSVEKVFFQSENSYRLTDSIFKDKQVDFTNLTFGHPDTAVIDKNVSFYWDFIGDGIFTEHAFNTSYEYDESGQFMVQLLAVDEMWGCKDTVAKPLTVVVNPNCGLTYPNAFTPDLDDNNNFYPIYNEGVLENGYELRIYNRWGALLWSTQDLYGKWDGVYKGEIAKQDVYVYHVKAVCEEKDPATGEHRVLNIKGDVTVIR